MHSSSNAATLLRRIAAYPPVSTSDPWTVSYVVGTWTATALYGMLVILFGMTVQLLYQRARKRSHISIILSIAGLCLFVSTSIDIVLQCNHILNGLLYTVVPELDMYFQNTGVWWQVAQDVLHYANFLIGDFTMLYRAWIVWDKRWAVVAFNILVWLAAIAGSARTVQIQVALTHDQTNLSLISNVVNWSIAVVALSVTQTTIATSLIAYRLWKVDRASGALKEGSFMPVVRILVESGVLYTAYMLAVVVVLALECPPLEFFSQLGSPVTAIAFFLIIVRATSHNTGTYSTTVASSRPRMVAVSHEVALHRLEEGDSSSAIGEGSLKMKNAGNASTLRLND